MSGAADRSPTRNMQPSATMTKIDKNLVTELRISRNSSFLRLRFTTTQSFLRARGSRSDTSG